MAADARVDLPYAARALGFAVNNTLQLISIQHELGMAIGMELLLQPMLQRFTKVCMRRLGLTEMHFYFFQNDEGLPTLTRPNARAQLATTLSLPSSATSPGVAEVTSIYEQLASEGCRYHEQVDAERAEYSYYFNLAQLGVVSLHRLHQPIEQTLLNLLKTLFRRLTVSCQASIEHEHLLQAIDAREKAEQMIRFQLYHDDLTQLPNRRMMLETLNKQIKQMTASGSRGALLFIDLDRFKAVNDTLGHAVGDSLLIAVSKAFVDIVGERKYVGRLSGDEFVALLTPGNCPRGNLDEHLECVLNKIREAFSKPVRAGKHLLHITPSVGVEFFPQQGLSAETILRHADTAMYIAKSKGPNSAVIYEPQMSVDLDTRQQVEKKLHIAIEDLSQFSLVYQPQFDTRGACIGAEALVRWERENFSPAQFIPVAEETGLMLELGRWILTLACQHIHEIQRHDPENSFKRLMVNVSAIQFNQCNFVSDLLAIVENAGVSPRALGIELTESALIENMNDMVTKIASLRKLGFHISIDDFGTGYSSLAYLSRFPIHTLKIDQAFVRDLHRDKGNRAIVETIMALGKSLSLSIIAEGVETEHELDCLRKLGCELFQGYFFSRPLSFAELKLRVAENRLRSDNTISTFPSTQLGY